MMVKILDVVISIAVVSVLGFALNHFVLDAREPTPQVIQCWNPLVPPRSILVDAKVDQLNGVYRGRSGFLFVPLPGDVCKVTPLSMELEKQQGEKQ